MIKNQIINVILLKEKENFHHIVVGNKYNVKLYLNAINLMVSMIYIIPVIITLYFQIVKK